MNKYQALRDKQEKDFSENSPTKYAYGEDQFSRMMESWDLDPVADRDKLYQVAPGAFILRTDSDKFNALMKRLDQEMKEAIEADQTGEDFIYDMFYYELNNHEYSYTGSLEDTLDYLGYTYEQVQSDPALKRGLQKALNQIRKDMENSDIY